jgi:hypothetical protein
MLSAGENMTISYSCEVLSSKRNDNFHYTSIKNMRALICYKSRHEGSAYIYRIVFIRFRLSELSRLYPDCSKHVYQVTKYFEPQSVCVA